MFGHDDQDNHDENNKPENEHKFGDQPADDIVKPVDDNWQHPGPPPADDDSDNNDTPSAPAGFSLNHSEPKDTPAISGPVDKSADNDLIDLKQEALTKLSPLVDHLDQSPDEKFRTLMMMIQASDDQKLVREAYETALKISDEKDRAQALLDIVNEINYFTQNPGNKAD
jgi:hypothetical protein